MSSPPCSPHPHARRRRLDPACLISLLYSTAAPLPQQSARRGEDGEVKVRFFDAAASSTPAYSREMLAGGVAGVVDKMAVAPLGRLKLGIYRRGGFAGLAPRRQPVVVAAARGPPPTSTAVALLDHLRLPKVEECN